MMYIECCDNVIKEIIIPKSTEVLDCRKNPITSLNITDNLKELGIDEDKANYDELRNHDNLEVFITPKEFYRFDLPSFRSRNPF